MSDWAMAVRKRASGGSRHDVGLTRLLGVVVVLALLLAGCSSDDGDKNKGSASVAPDEQPLRTAEDAFHAKFKRYGTQDALVAAGLLSAKSPDKAINLQDGTCPGRAACTYTIGGRLERVRLAGSANSGYPSPFRASPGTGGIQNVSYLFDSLTWLDAKGDVIPALATSWETNVGGDPKKLRFALREGVKWADGVPFEADDVVFTWDYQRPGRPGHLGTHNAAAFAQKGVVNVAALNPTSVEFTMESADATFLYLAATRNFIVPRHIWEGVTDPQTWDDPKAQMGTGPYTLAAYNAAQGTYAFDAKDSYFMGQPYVKRVELVAAGQDPLQALQSGVVDLAEVGSGTYTKAQLDSLDPAAYGRLETGGILTYVIMWNMEKYPYNDKRFRQAVAKAIDRPDMASRLFPLGGGPTNIGMVQPADSPWNPPDVLKAYASKDVAGANTLLDAVGLARSSPTGMREMNGAPFRPTIQVCATDAFTAVAEYLRAVGIDAQAQAVTCDFGPASQMNNNATSGNYEMILRSFGPTSDPDGLRSFLSEPAPPGTWWHSWGWPKASPAKQAEFEKLLNEQRAELNEANRIKKSWDLQRLVADELPQYMDSGARRRELR